MDWESLAWRALEEVPDPAVVLDAEHRVVVINGPMELILARMRQECLGKVWSGLTGEPRTEDEIRWWISRALRGAVTQGTLPVFSRDGKRFTVVAHGASVGVGAEVALLITLREIRSGPSVPIPEPKGVEYYEVEAREGELGPIVSHWPAAEEEVERGLGLLPCHRYRYDTSQPCSECPVPRARLDGGPAVAVIRAQGDDRAYHLVSALRTSDTRVRVTVHHIDEGMLDKLVRARVDELAEGAGLSSRERDVLDYLLMGRTLGDIAKILEISPRTVKFHQSNILQKLGADSRMDLMRILF